MSMYKVSYRLINDREMLISGNNEDEAKDHAELAIDPDNEYDGFMILGIEETKEGE